jgi:transcription termination factor Rho
LLAIPKAVQPVIRDYDMTDEYIDDSEIETEEVSEGPGKHAGERMSLQELKEKSPAELVSLAESLDIENASSLRKQGMMFAILKALADEGAEISGGGTLEVLQDGFGFLRAPESNYLPGPDDIYVSPQPDPPLRLAHGRFDRRRNPRATGQ